MKKANRTLMECIEEIEADFPGYGWLVRSVFRELESEDGRPPRSSLPYFANVTSPDFRIASDGRGYVGHTHTAWGDTPEGALSDALDKVWAGRPDSKESKK